MSKKVLQQWKAPGSGKKPYTVTRYDDDTYACGCPHWIYRCRAEGKNCKHIENAIDGLYDEVMPNKKIRLVATAAPQFHKREETENYILYGYPLVPPDGHYWCFVATIIYDACVTHSIPWSTFVDLYFHGNKPARITLKAAKNHVATYGRMIWKNHYDEEGHVIKTERISVPI